MTCSIVTIVLNIFSYVDPLTEVQFNFLSFLVRFYNLPIICTSASCGKELGAQYGYNGKTLILEILESVGVNFFMPESSRLILLSLYEGELK